jgi:hypothetical protein
MGLIEENEWKHVRWFYDYCNWRKGWARETFAVTSATHGAQLGMAKNPCDTLYRLLILVREYVEAKDEKGWEDIYRDIVKRRDQVMRKGKEETKKPKIVRWG